MSLTAITLLEPQPTRIGWAAAARDSHWVRFKVVAWHISSYGAYIGCCCASVGLCQLPCPDVGAVEWVAIWVKRSCLSLLQLRDTLLGGYCCSCCSLSACVCVFLFLVTAAAWAIPVAIFFSMGLFCFWPSHLCVLKPMRTHTRTLLGSGRPLYHQCEWRRAWKTFFINMNFPLDICFVFFLCPFFTFFLLVFFFFVFAGIFETFWQSLLYLLSLHTLPTLKLSSILCFCLLFSVLKMIWYVGVCIICAAAGKVLESTSPKWRQLIGLCFHLFILLSALSPYPAEGLSQLNSPLTSSLLGLSMHWSQNIEGLISYLKLKSHVKYWQGIAQSSVRFLASA